MIEIIPAIDIIDGKCVRLEKGDYSKKKIYSSDPLETSRMFESWGVKRLHLVDLDGAKASGIVNYGILNRIASSTSLIIDFGGGIKTDADIKIAFENGASMVTCGSIAVKSPDKVAEWLELYGEEKIILGTDHRKGKIAYGGWLEDSEVEIFSFIRHYSSIGIKKLISTDIDKDGMLQGPSLEIYQQILDEFQSLYLIASGGVSDIDDVKKLSDIGVPAVIIGKAIYEGKITEKNLRTYL